MRKILIILCTMFIGIAYACDTNQIDVNGDGTQCETAKFTITTTELEPDTEFKFYMSARGTFYVDWGDGTIDTITRTNTTETLYDHTYTSGGIKTIRFGGIATGYSTATRADGNPYAPITFSGTSSLNLTEETLTPTLIASIAGNLSAMFPSNSQIRGYPQFYRTFCNAENLTALPETLFADYTVGGYRMFPNTFRNCTGLTSIPAGLFSRITTGAVQMFVSTFVNCTGLTSIPADLFSGITTGASYMFRSTFSGCTGLTSIPAGLFSGITTGATDVFGYTFYNCTNLSGYIPPSTFAGLIANGSPTSDSMWNNTFSGTKLVKSCPAGTVQYTTGYEGVDTTNYTKWDGYVSCVDENLVCGAGEYLPQHWYQCEKCPENNYCVGGTYPYSETNSSGAIQCSTGLYSPVGMWESAQCGRILHIGDNVVYLRSTKKTSPALHIDIDNDGVADFFGNMTTADIPMTNGTTRKLKLQYGGQTYSVYDDSVNVGG